MSDRYEDIDVEVRTPTVVLSVRLDEKVAKELHRQAKQRGVRVSDILREAARQYAQTTPRPSGAVYVVEGGQNVGLGVSSVSTQSPREVRRPLTAEPASRWITAVTADSTRRT
jgi:hypothetical protein